MEDNSGVYEPGFIKHIKDNLLVIGLLSVGYILRYVINFILVRSLSPHQYGDVSIILGILTFSVPFALLGVELSSVRFLPEYLKLKQLTLFKGFYYWAFRICIYASLAIMIGGLLLIVFDRAFIAIYHDHLMKKIHPFFYSIWLISMYSYLIYQSSILKSFGKFLFSQGAIILYTIIFIIELMFFDRFFSHLTPIRVIICLGVAAFIIIVFQQISITYFFPKKVKNLEVNLSKSGQWLSTSLQMMFSSIVFSGLSVIDLVMLEFLGKTEAVVGHFAAINAIALSIFVFENAINIVISPIIAPLVQNKEMKKLQHFMNVSTLVKLGMAIPLCVIFVLFGKEILGFFGSVYVSFYHELLLLVLTYIIAVSFGTGNIVTLNSGNHLATLRIALTQLILDIILNVILIPIYGLLGAVLAMLISSIYVSIAYLLVVRAKLKLKLLFVI